MRSVVDALFVAADHEAVRKAGRGPFLLGFGAGHGRNSLSRKRTRKYWITVYFFRAHVYV